MVPALNHLILPYIIPKARGKLKGNTPGNRIPEVSPYIIDWPCTCCRLTSTSVTRVVDSNQASLRHTKVIAYRCFLPNLAEFTGFRCARPNFHRHLHGADPTKVKPRTGIQPCCSGLQVQGTATSPSSTAKD